MFRCWYAPDGLPERFVFWPDATGNEPTVPPLKMFLAESSAREELESYLTGKLGLTKGVDFTRHAMGYRGGARYFDINTDTAVARLLARAEELGTGPATGRLERPNPPSPGR